MPIIDNLKRGFERATGIGQPSRSAMRKAVQNVAPRTFMFKDDGRTPNNPTLPLLVYKGALDLTGAADPAAVFERLFETNGWGSTWRNGIYDYLHYHSAIHEVLGVARGVATVRFGGGRGRVLALAAGDAVVLPAGTGHQQLSASDDFLVVGAYPPRGEYDECRGRAGELARARDSIPQVALPTKDPLRGRAGPLVQVWRKTAANRDRLRRDR